MPTRVSKAYIKAIHLMEDVMVFLELKALPVRRIRMGAKVFKTYLTAPKMPARNTEPKTDKVRKVWSVKTEVEIVEDPTLKPYEVRVEVSGPSMEMFRDMEALLKAVTHGTKRT